jgi:hypothetical protein
VPEPDGEVGFPTNCHLAWSTRVAADACELAGLSSIWVAQEVNASLTTFWAAPMPASVSFTVRSIGRVDPAARAESCSKLVGRTIKSVWAAHGVGGLTGVILLGVFASVAINSAGADGLVFGGVAFFGKQVAASVLVAGYAMGMTWLILKVLDRFERVRVPDDLEQLGLDMEMGEQYTLG